MERTDLLAREAIRDLLARFTWAADDGVPAELAELFAAEGVLVVDEPAGRWEGRAHIAAELTANGDQPRGVGPGRQQARHHVSNVVIDLDHHALATVRSYFLVVTNTGADHWGRYRDRVAETVPGGRWQFLERIVMVDGRVDGSFVTVPDPA